NDFLGGSLYELKFATAGATESNLRDVFEQHGNTDISIQRLGDAEENRWSVRANFQDQVTQDAIITALNDLAPLDRDSLRVEQVSATVGQEVTRSAFFAVVIAAVVV